MNYKNILMRQGLWEKGIQIVFDLNKEMVREIFLGHGDHNGSGQKEVAKGEESK